MSEGQEFDLDAELNGEAGPADGGLNGADEATQDQSNGQNEGAEEDGEGEQDEDEEDEDEEGSAEESNRPAKRRKIKRKGNRFIDIEAEVDEDDDEEDDDEDGLGAADGFVVTGQDQAGPEEEFDEASASRQNRAYDRQHRDVEEKDLHKIAEALDARERDRRRAAREADEMGASGQLPRNYLMPDINDPTIWALKVKPGREQALILSISRKAATQEMGIVSAFFRDSLKGYIYVEARSEAHVRSAVHGLVGVYATNQPLLIPLEERPDLLKTRKKDIPLQVGGWVRFKRGRYAGDVAQIVDVPENADAITVKFVPRIDMNPKEEEVATEGKKRKKAPSNTAAFRPPQHFFNADEIKSVYSARSVSYAKGVFHFQNDDFEDGYCIKDVRLTALNIEDINPTIDEITKFAGEARSAAKATKDGELDEDDQQADRDRDQSALNLSLIADAARKTANLALQPGDHVEIFEGDSKGIIGLVESIVNDVVTIAPSEDEHPDLSGTKMDVEIKSVRKKFKVGDHVKVLSGANADETGLVVSLNRETVTFHSDLSGEEITVFAKDVREAAEVGSGVNTIGQYQLHDLVQLDAQTCGVIYKIERGVFRVLDQSGQVKGVRPQNLQGKVVSNSALATDADGHTVNAGDTMKETAGSYSSVQRTGKILHIYRSLFAFLYSRDYAENGGVFVTYAQYLTSAAPKQKRGTDFTKLNPELMPPPSSRTPLTEDTNIAGTSGVKRIRDPIVGMLVTIMKGPQKGFQGIVKDVNGQATRIELSSNNKTVNIDRSRLYAKGRNGLAPVDAAIHSMRPNSAPRGDGPPGQFHNNNPRTPSYGAGGGGRTANPYGGGGRTANAYANGGMTANPYSTGGGATANPYANNGGSTVNPYAGGATPGGARSSYGGDSFAAGSRTPYGGSGGDSFNPSAKTPYGGQNDTWSASSKTPYSGQSGTSNNYTQNSGAQSPYHAPNSYSAYGSSSGYGQPGRDRGAPPTAPTPYSAPTPYANNANTPYTAAPTPAPSGQRFEDPERRAMREAELREQMAAPTPAAHTPAPSWQQPSGTATNSMPLANSRWGSSAASAPTPAAATPGQPLSAPTPGASYDRPMTAPTPGFSAPTPGAFSAPTPGGFGAPTPGFTGQTPGVYGQTPGPGYGAPTPAAGLHQAQQTHGRQSTIPDDWAALAMLVTIRELDYLKKPYMQGQHSGKQGTIVDVRVDTVNALMCQVSLPDDEETLLPVPVRHLAPVEPWDVLQDAIVIAGKYRRMAVVTNTRDDEQWLCNLADGSKDAIESAVLCVYDKKLKDQITA